MVLSLVALWNSSWEMMTGTAFRRMISVAVEGVTAWPLGTVVEEARGRCFIGFLECGFWMWRNVNSWGLLWT